jgi:hypothetical protein
MAKASTPPPPGRHPVISLVVAVLRVVMISLVMFPAFAPVWMGYGWRGYLQDNTTFDTCNGNIDESYFPHPDWDAWGDTYHIRMIASTSTSFLVALFAGVGMKYVPNAPAFVTHARCWLMLNWVLAAMWTFGRAYQWCDSTSPNPGTWLWNLRQVVWAASATYLTFLLRMRIVALQSAQGEAGHHMNWMFVIVALQCVVLLGVTACVVIRLTTGVSRDWFGTIAHTLLTILLALTVFGLALAIDAFKNPLRAAQHIAKQTIGRRGMEAQRSFRTVRWELMVTLFCGVTSVLAFATEFASHVLYVYHREQHDYIYEIFKTFFYGLDMVANAAVVLLLSGLVRIRQPVRTTGTYTSCTAGTKEWDENVKELADRGITLGALLGFYSGLGQRYMPHFNPDMHSTADVVRQAIIPLTATNSNFGPCALSTQLMGGASIRAQCMVTHAWSNKFADLIAAIVADALGLLTY